MKNILSKIPSFIYSLIIVCIALILGISYILNNLDPENFSSKIIFCFLIFLTSLVTIPTVRIIFLIFEEEYYSDYREKFRGFFGENFIFSIFLGFIMILKTFRFLNFTAFLSLFLGFMGISFAYRKLKKPRRIKRI